jgi:alpha/beta hydrolase family protein
MRRCLSVCVLLAAGALPGTAAAAGVPNPTVVGPVYGGVHGFPSNHSTFPLAGPGYDYSESEYFYSGTATDLSNGTTAPYTTRMLVRIPRDPTKFNGIVLVDWMNVTDGQDFEFTWWPSAWQYLMQQGYGYVAVTAQQVGANFLPAWDPQRYATIHIPNDNYSFDIFSQAIQAIRHPAGNVTSILYPRPVDPMQGMGVKYVVAGGVSQSAGRLDDFINGGYNRGLINAYNIERDCCSRITNFSTFVFGLNEETPLVSSEPPDNQHYVLWQEAGASHETTYWWYYREDTMANQGETPPNSPDPVTAACSTLNSDEGVNEGRIDQRARAMLYWTQQYLTRGIRPPSAPRINYDANGNPVRDANGLALGGLRDTFIQVPIALNRGDGCVFWGQYEPWSDQKIRSLYPTHADYVNKVTTWANYEVQQGWLLPVDRTDDIVQARAFDRPWTSSG